MVVAYSSTAAERSLGRDEFGSVAYNNNNGTRNWAGGWIEVGDEGDPNTDSIRMAGGRLRIKDNVSASIYRSANLAGATAATLTMDLAANTLNEAGHVIKLQASIDGGSSWTDLARSPA